MKSLLRISICSALITTALAYPYDNTLSSLPESGSLIGTGARASGTVETYNIPLTDWPDEIAITMQGGDGGRAKANASAGSDKTADGGGGLLQTCTFPIHPTNANSLRPGGEIRFVIGNQGSDKTRNDTSGAGGGGGTAVLYRAPEVDADWTILAVAGGGGGGAASALAVDTYSHDGKNANATTSGDDGGGSAGGSGGTNGGAGQESSGGAGGGGSHKSDADLSRGGKKGEGPAGDFTGGVGGENVNGGSNGGFGFGGGGGGWTGDSSDVDGEDGAGGGGGGYSGGGAGSWEGREGGGAGSYIDTTLATAYTQTERNSSRSNGYATWIATKNTSNGTLTGPTVTLLGNDPESFPDYQASYSDAGATATDIYGNPATIDPLVLSTVIVGTPGTYSVTYTATDQFGITGSGTSRTVEIFSYNKPTFTLSGDVTRNEDSGTYFQSSFAYNRNANDSGQSIQYFTVTNDNNSLFETQPAISSAGMLSFKPASNANGSATVTVIAVDNPDDTNNGSSDPVNFTINITSVDDPPTNFNNTVTSTLENDDFAGTVYATDPLGGWVTFMIVGGTDQAFFSLTSTGNLSFITPPDYENPQDNGGGASADNIYEVTIRATGTDGYVDKGLTIEVIDTNEAPDGLSLDNNMVEENISSVGTLTGTDPDDDALTYTVSGGADGGLFQIVGDQLSFITAPDFESPQDNGADNVYSITISASDGTLSFQQALSITVTEVSEAPSAILIDGADKNSATFPESADNGDLIATFSAEDDDAGDTFTFVLTADANGRFGIVNDDELVLLDASQIDRDSDSSHRITVQVTDSDNNSINKEVVVFVGQVDKATLEGFRAFYNLALDGSDDDADWSNNGVANILYLAFGLGDPNEADIDRSLLPTFDVSVNNGITFVTITYLQPLSLGTLTVTPQYSADLVTWTDNLVPFQSSLDSPNGDYDKYTLNFFNPSGWSYFRVKVEDSSLP